MDDNRIINFLKNSKKNKLMYPLDVLAFRGIFKLKETRTIGIQCDLSKENKTCETGVQCDIDVLEWIMIGDHFCIKQNK